MAARREQGVWVNASDERATIIVNPDGTPVSAGGGGGVSIVDDSTFTIGVSSLTVTGGVVTADSVDSGDAGAFAMLANRQQKVSLYDSSGVEITSFGGGTQYTEDAPAAANPVAPALIVVRDDARSGSLTNTDGDNVALRGTNAGEVYVKHVDAVAVTNAGLTALAGAIGGNEVQVDVLTMPSTAVTNDGLTELAAAINASSQMDVNLAASNATVTVATHAVTNAAGAFVVQENGAALTALQLIDDPVATLGTTTYTETSTKGMIVGAVRRDADTTLVDTTNEVGPLQMNSAGQLKVEVFSGETLPISGTVTAALASGTNNIGDVDVLSLTPGVGATSLGKAEDAQHTSGDVGVMTLGVRQSTQTDFGADNDYVPFSVDDDGGLRVSIVAGAGSGGTASADDADFIAGTTSGTPAMGVFESAPTNVTDGDMGVVGITIARRMKTSATIDAALPAGTNGIGKLTSNAGVTIGAVEIAAAQTLATVTTVSTVTAVTTLTGGGIAHDGADSGNPHKVGGRAINAEIAAVANNDRSDLVTDLVGKLIVLPYANPENFVSGAITSAMTGTTTTSLLAAPAGSLRNYVTTIVCSNAHGTVGTDIVIQDGSGGTTLMTIPAAAVYGGAVIHLPVPLRQPTAATALFCANVTTGASTKVSAVGYKGL